MQYSEFPIERKAMAMRMKNMSPVLLNETTFEIVASNPQVGQYLLNMKESILKEIRSGIGNSKIQMSIRIAQIQEVQYITSKPAMFKLMTEKNQNLQRLAELLNLEIS